MRNYGTWAWLYIPGVAIEMQQFFFHCQVSLLQISIKISIFITSYEASLLARFSEFEPGYQKMGHCRY